MGVLELLGLKKSEPKKEQESGNTETVRKIVSALDQMEPDKARFIASFAYILSRVANADLDISKEEVDSMERIIRDQGHLPLDQAMIVVQMAKTHSQLFGSTEDFLVTREFNEMATREQKLSLLQCLFAVSAADDSISSEEDSEIRKIASELMLDHEDFIAARVLHSQYLEVLKQP